MSGFNLSIPALCGIAMLLAGCGSSSIWTAYYQGQVPADIDGAVLDYALAQGEVTLTADYKNGHLTISAPQSIKATADYGDVHHLVYDHNNFSDDEIEIKMDGALVTSLSSTTEDKSTAVAKGITDLITQVGQTRKDVLENIAVVEKKKNDDKPPPPCSDMQWVQSYNLTHGSVGRGYYTTPHDDGCSLSITIAPKPQPRHILGVSGFVAPLATEQSIQLCDHVFCFRRAGVYTVTATAEVNNHGIKTPAGPITFDVMAPSLKLAFIRFNRRAFVANKTEIEFQNGIVSRFHAKNPSEVVGFLEFPTQVLKGVSAAIIIH